MRERNIHVYINMHIQYILYCIHIQVFMFEHTCCSTVSSATEAPPPNREYMVT